MRISPGTSRSTRLIVLLGLGLLLVLGGTLALRLAGFQPLLVLLHQSLGSDDPAPVAPGPRVWNDGAPRPGEVPNPRPVTAEDLVLPSWASPGGDTPQPVRFRIDLDTIAPLGDGPENAALWFAAFSRAPGGRMAEYDEALNRAQAANPGVTLLPDDPMLLEAEPWIDQATMRFYPDVWQPEGWEIDLPNLMVMLSLARSWTARADANDDLEGALVDYRRAIRLGRLARQEDAILVTDLVGLACIRIGLKGIYRRLVEVGDIDGALIVSLALGDGALQRAKTSEVLTSISMMGYLRPGWLNNELSMTNDALYRLMRTAGRGPDRRFRVEAIQTLNIVRFEGTREQRRETAELLDRLAESNDPWIAHFADVARSTRYQLSHIVLRQ